MAKTTNEKKTDEAKAETDEAKQIDYAANLGGAVSLESLAKDFKGRELDAFNAIAKAAGHGTFVNANGVTLAMPTSASEIAKINEALNNL